ncbi:Acidic endochitinase [Rhizoclosmatium sp. JEL0117]|nr:Acidic endochitinase [Rhizoclosmatium sp. JEL0117]
MSLDSIQSPANTSGERLMFGSEKKPVAADPAKRKRYIIIAAIVVVIVAIAAGLGGYFGSKKSSNSSSNNSQSSSNDPSAVAKPTLKNALIGYFGQNAVANGIGIVTGLNGRNTSVDNYQRTLAYYCSTGYYNTINIAFLNLFGGGDNHFTITLSSFSAPHYGGNYIYKGFGGETNQPWIVNQYIQMGQDILTCQKAGVKVVLSLGGDKVSAYQFASGDGVAYANLFYNVFLEGTAGPVRPFGTGVILDGIELDIEKNDNSVVGTPEMVNFITTLRKLSPKTIIAVVPQCYLGLIGKDENVGTVIEKTSGLISYLIVQYYNNPQCSYPFGFNFDKWKSLYSGSIVVGLAGDWTSAISGGFLEAGPLQAVYDMISSDPQFGGFSVYDVSSSNPPALAYTATNYVSPPQSAYSKTLRAVLDGSRVGSGFPPQGPQQSNINLANRCGGTWVYANSICSLRTCDPALTVTGCAPNEQCFSFLSKTCV